jgi:YHS domain-containing protein
MTDLFSTPISKTKVRNGVYAYKYPNGCINIDGQKYFFYSIKNAIKLWRQNNPIK